MSIRYLVALLPLLLFALCATAADKDLGYLVEDAATVEEAVTQIVEVLEDEGYEIPLIVNHAAAADSVGLFLRPTQVIFATPTQSLLAPLLRRGETLGIDLPQKFLVFEDEDDSIQLRYNPIGYLIDRHQLRIKDSLFSRVRAKSEQLGKLEDGLVTVPSHKTVDETLAALEAAISANPAFRIPLILTYEGPRDSKRFLVVFGNPAAGTPLMQETQEAAIDLPQKMLIWEDRADAVFITYNDPFFVAKRHNVQGQDERLEAIATALAGFAATAAGEP